MGRRSESERAHPPCTLDKREATPSSANCAEAVMAGERGGQMLSASSPSRQFELHGPRAVALLCAVRSSRAIRAAADNIP